MRKINNENQSVLALGAESVGIFAVYKNGNIFISENFGDLLDESNFLKYKKSVLNYFKKGSSKLDIILTDLHPLYKTTIFGEELAKKHKARHIKVQHHIAHIFSAVGDKMIDIDKLEKNYYCRSEHGEESRTNVRQLAFARDSSLRLHSVQNDKTKSLNTFYGIAMDGTGYGLDGNVWGGEVFKFQLPNSKYQTIKIIRIGSLEEQTMIGGDLAVKEPARMVIAIIAKLKAQNLKLKTKTKNSNPIELKNGIYNFVNKFYTKNEFELLYNQLEQNFNCQITTSTGRVLDAVSVLLGFAGNERRYKHEATKLLEEKSTVPYDDLDLRLKMYNLRIILDTTYLFKYLIKNIRKDKRRLAATAQLYIAKGLYEMIKLQTKNYRLNTVFAAGGLSNNKIISEYLEKQGVYMSKKIPRGDEGMAVGQVVYYLLNKMGI